MQLDATSRRGRLLRSLATLAVLSTCRASRAPPKPHFPSAGQGCVQDCSGHGRCRDESWCECDLNWAGDACSYFVESSANAEIAGKPVQSLGARECQDWCSGHGQCNAGICHCIQGWTGANCNVESRCVDSCNSPSGSCVDGVCICEAGFSGPTCAERACPNGCWGHGTCTAGQCSCWPGWVGEDCGLKQEGPLPNAGAAALASWPVDTQSAVAPAQDLQAATPQEWPSQPVQEAPPAEEKIVVEPDNSADMDAARYVRADVEEPAPPANAAATTQPRPATPITMLQMPTAQATASLQLRAAIGAAHRAVNAANSLAKKGSAASNLQMESRPAGSGHSQGTVKTTINTLHAKPEKRPVTPAPLAGSAKTTYSSGPNIVKFLQMTGTAQRKSKSMWPWGSSRHGNLRAASAAVTDLTAGIGASTLNMQQVVKASGKQLPTTAPLPTGQCVEDCSGHGFCQGGKCQCNGGWTGEACDLEPCPGNCNGRGTCLMGSCACGTNYFGLACENIRCPDDCSGHGFCNEGVCQCNAGYSGSNCAPVQPAAAVAGGAVVIPAKSAQLRSVLAKAESYGTKPSCPGDCSGHGRCGDDGQCACVLGYSGESCSEFCPNNCAGHGACTLGVCLCNVGWEGDDCGSMNCCSGHGACDPPGSCVCQPGWVGDDCEVELACADPACNSHGECRLGRCECQMGWSGETCANWPRECGGPCPAEGQCDRSTGLCMCGGTPCKTPEGSTPTIPVFSLLDHSQPSQHNLHGRPAVSSAPDNNLLSTLPDNSKLAPLRLLNTGSAATYSPPPPTCNTPHGRWDDSLGACACELPYFGEECENMHCPGFSEELGIADCSGHGRCVAGECICAAGFGIATGKTGPNNCGDEVCPVDCGAHGMCKNNQCICQEGWQGPACRLPKCRNDCSGHGSCYFVSAHSLGECVCEYGFSLPDCSQPALYTRMPECPNSCSGNGLCFSGKCVCTTGFSGVDCSEVTCPEGRTGPKCEFAGCRRNCNGQGLCMGGKCVCSPDHVGEDCSIPAQCFSACGEVCMADLEGQNCEVCKGQCLTLTAGHSMLGQHDPMNDLMSTLQRRQQNVTAVQHPPHVPPTVLPVKASTSAQPQQPTPKPALVEQKLDLRLHDCPTACSGNGLCMDGQCVCSSGFGGDDCSVVALQACDSGRSGPSCEFAACPRDCDGKGLCLGGQCACDPSHTGPDCSMPVQCLSSCGADCLTDLQGQACESCKVTCLANPPRQQAVEEEAKNRTMQQQELAALVAANTNNTKSLADLGAKVVSEVQDDDRELHVLAGAVEAIMHESGSAEHFAEANPTTRPPAAPKSDPTPALNTEGVTKSKIKVEATAAESAPHQMPQSNGSSRQASSDINATLMSKETASLVKVLSGVANVSFSFPKTVTNAPAQQTAASGTTPQTPASKSMNAVEVSETTIHEDTSDLWTALHTWGKATDTSDVKVAESHRILQKIVDEPVVEPVVRHAAPVNVNSSASNNTATSHANVSAQREITMAVKNHSESNTSQLNASHASLHSLVHVHAGSQKNSTHASSPQSPQHNLTGSVLNRSQHNLTHLLGSDSSQHNQTHQVASHGNLTHPQSSNGSQHNFTHLQPPRGMHHNLTQLELTNGSEHNQTHLLVSKKGTQQAAHPQQSVNGSHSKLNHVETHNGSQGNQSHNWTLLDERNGSQHSARSMASNVSQSEGPHNASLKMHALNETAGNHTQAIQEHFPLINATSNPHKVIQAGPDSHGSHHKEHLLQRSMLASSASSLRNWGVPGSGSGNFTAFSLNGSISQVEETSKNSSHVSASSGNATGLANGTAAKTKTALATVAAAGNKKTKEAKLPAEIKRLANIAQAARKSKRSHKELMTKVIQEGSHKKRRSHKELQAKVIHEGAAHHGRHHKEVMSKVLSTGKAKKRTHSEVMTKVVRRVNQSNWRVAVAKNSRRHREEEVEVLRNSTKSRHKKHHEEVVQVLQTANSESLIQAEKVDPAPPHRPKPKRHHVEVEQKTISKGYTVQ